MCLLPALDSGYFYVLPSLSVAELLSCTPVLTGYGILDLSSLGLLRGRSCQLFPIMNGSLWCEALPVVLSNKESMAVLDCKVLASGYSSCNNE